MTPEAAAFIRTAAIFKCLQAGHAPGCHCMSDAESVIDRGILEDQIERLESQVAIWTASCARNQERITALRQQVAQALERSSG